MFEWLRRFCIEEDGQDIIEYSLLICFVAIACMWFVGEGRDPVKGIWTTSNTHITAANAAANGQ